MFCGGNDEEGVTVCGRRDEGVNGPGRCVAGVFEPPAAAEGPRPDSPETTLAYDDRLNIWCAEEPWALLALPLPLVLRCEPDPPPGTFGLFDMVATL